MIVFPEILKDKKSIYQTLIYFLTFIFIFFLIDYLNISYPEMITTYGLYLVIINIFLNIIMAFLNAVLLKGSEMMSKGKNTASSLGFFSVIFGMFTYGCTPCIITFFANLGIVFSVMVLPLAGLPYKLISLAIIIIGLILTTRQIKKPCKVK